MHGHVLDDSVVQLTLLARIKTAAHLAEVPLHVVSIIDVAKLFALRQV